MAITLVDLMEKDHPSKYVLETFRDYAESGAAISAHSIKTILDKSSLTREELDTAYQHMQTGMVRQIASSQGIEGLQYFQAMNSIARKIAETMAARDATSVKSDDFLAVIKSELVLAHMDNSKPCLEKAVDAFQRYVLQTNPAEFEQYASVVNLTGPGPKILKKSYHLARYGGSISVHAYLMGIHATDDLQISEAPARK